MINFCGCVTKLQYWQLPVGALHHEFADNICSLGILYGIPLLLSLNFLPDLVHSFHCNVMPPVVACAITIEAHLFYYNIIIPCQHSNVRNSYWLHRKVYHNTDTLPGSTGVIVCHIRAKGEMIALIFSLAFVSVQRFIPVRGILYNRSYNTFQL